MKRRAKNRIWYLPVCTTTSWMWTICPPLADYDSLEAGKATGVDGVSKQQYGRELESNLQELSERLGRMELPSGSQAPELYSQSGQCERPSAGDQQF